MFTKGFDKQVKVLKHCITCFPHGCDLIPYKNQFVLIHSLKGYNSIMVGKAWLNSFMVPWSYGSRCMRQPICISAERLDLSYSPAVTHWVHTKDSLPSGSLYFLKVL